MSQDDLLAQIARLDPSADAVRAILPLDGSKRPDERALYDLLESAGVKSSLDELEGGYRPILVGADGELVDAVGDKNATEDAAKEHPQTQPNRSGWLRASPVLSLSLSCATALLGFGCVSLGLYAYHGSRKMLGITDQEKAAEKHTTTEKPEVSEDAKYPREKAQYNTGLGLLTEPPTTIDSPTVDDGEVGLNEKAFPIIPTDPPSYTPAHLERALERFATSTLPPPVFATPPTSPQRIPVILAEGASSTPPQPDISPLPLLTPLPSLADLALTSPPRGPSPSLGEAGSPNFLRLPVPLQSRPVPSADARPDAPAWSLRATEAVSPLPSRLEPVEVPKPALPSAPQSPTLPGALIDSPALSPRALATRSETQGRVERLAAARAMLSLVDVGDPAWMVRVLVVLVGWVFGVVGGRSANRIAAVV